MADESRVTSDNQEQTKKGYLGKLFEMNTPQEPVFYQAAEKALERLVDIKKDDVKGTAASQIELLSRFYDLALSQAQRSFRWALAAAVVGLVFFMVAILFSLTLGAGSDTAIVTLIGGAMIEFISAINFYLYNKTLSQLTLFQGRLETTQRFLLANSLTESLSDEYRDKVRAKLIIQLADSQFEKLAGKQNKAHNPPSSTSVG